MTSGATMDSLPNILISKQFEVSNINDSFTDVKWKSAILNVDDNISFGVTRQVEIEDDNSREKQKYQIVGEYESDIENKKLSISSPLAKGLILSLIHI